MRVATGLIVAISLCMPGIARAQSSPPKAAAAPQAAAPMAAPVPAPAAAAPAQSQVQPARAPCTNPNALGVARTVEIDTTGGPGFGFEHFKELDFLRDHEVVLTFDDGPWQENTPSVLKSLAEECTTGIFFTIGKHATYYPIAPAAFFRFPALQHPPEMVTYLGTRNVAIFSCDLDSFDFKARNAQQVIDVTFKKLDKLGKGIILMHDFHKHTAEALPELLRRLKAGGYKVVAMRAKAPVQSLPQYDEEMLKDAKLPTLSQRPVSSVVTTVSE